VRAFFRALLSFMSGAIASQSALSASVVPVVDAVAEVDAGTLGATVVEECPPRTSATSNAAAAKRTARTLSSTANPLPRGRPLSGANPDGGGVDEPGGVTNGAPGGG